MTKLFTEEQLQAAFGHNPGKFADRLSRWMRDPASEPEIEFWYLNYALKGRDLPRQKQQWEIEAEKYLPMINRALALEKQGKPNEALGIYLSILARFQPIGTAYYERPAILLDRAGRTAEAIAITRMALDNPRLSRSHDDFRRRLERLVKKFAKQYAKQHPKNS